MKKRLWNYSVKPFTFDLGNSIRSISVTKDNIYETSYKQGIIGKPPSIRRLTFTIRDKSDVIRNIRMSSKRKR